MADARRNHAFSYGGDEQGLRCPVGAHVRRANPRLSLPFEGAMVNRHRLIRRGIPYGPPLPPDALEDDGVDRGVLFMCLQASLARQFEFVQSQWLNRGNAFGLGEDEDGMLGPQDAMLGPQDATPGPPNGTGAAPKKMTVPGRPPFFIGPLSRVVTVRGGEYFFVPGTNGLHFIAAAAGGRRGLSRSGGGTVPVSVQGASERRADLVFEGGGVKGIGLAGAYWTLYEQGYRPGLVAGTSAGAITAALVAVGYSGEELREIVLNEMDFPRFADKTGWDRFGVLGEALEFLLREGMHSGDYFLNWIRGKLQEKQITKFGQLRTQGETGEYRQYKLQVIASDLSARSMLVLPHDAEQLGVDPDELEIATAVRMSMSIPVFFEPVTQRDEEGREHTIVDGGLLSNYPIWLFDAPANATPTYPTFGMLLVANDQSDPLLPKPDPNAPLPSVSSPVHFVEAIGETMMEAHDRFYVEQADYARTIPIPTLGVKTTEFNIQPEQASALFDSGKEAADKFLQSWDFDKYVALFRTGPGQSRRASIWSR